jgi:hypothetical protein
MQSIPKKWLTRWILFIATLFITSAFALDGVKHWSGFLVPGVVFIFFLRHLGQLKLSHAAIMGGATAFLLLIPSFFIPDIWVGEPQHHVQYLVGIGSVSALMVAIFFSPLWWIFSLYVGPQFHFYPPFAPWIIIAVVNWAIYGALASFISERLRRKKKSVSIAKHCRKVPLRKSGKIETTIALTLIMTLLSGYGTIVFGHLNIELVEAVDLPEVEEYVAGDLHAHSDYSGYDRTIADMAERAQLIGYRFLMMTEYAQRHLGLGCFSNGPFIAF